MFHKHYACIVCGKEFGRYHRSNKKTCGPTCRKRHERAKEKHEKAMKQAEKFLWSLEQEDLIRLQSIIISRLNL